MRADEAHINNPEPVLDRHDQPIIVALEVEDDPIIRDETGVPINALNVGWTLPVRPLSVVIPRLDRHSRIRMLLPEFT